MGSSFLKQIDQIIAARKNIFFVLLLCICCLLSLSVAKAEEGRQLQKAIEFSWDKETSAAIFTRGDILWVVFDQQKNFDTDALIESAEGIVKTVSPIENRYYTILRLEMDKPRKVNVQKFGLSWQVHFALNDAKPLNAVHVESVNVSSSVPHLFIDVHQEGVQPIRVTDPVIGDEMLIIPLVHPNFGITAAKRYVDFEMMETAQGVALQLFTDEVKIYPERMAINLTSPSMELATTAPDIATTQPKILEKNSLPQTLLPFDEWAKDDPATFRDDLASREQAVLDALPEEEPKQRLKLAQFYLAHKFALEALAVINLIEQKYPKYAETTDVKLVEGVASFVARHYLEARKILSSIPPMQDKAKQEELDVWNLVAKAKLNKETKVPPFYLTYKDTFLTHYPLWLRQDLALTAAEQHITSGDLAIAEQTMAELNKMNKDGKITNDITFLKGLYAVKHNQPDKAIPLWEELTKDVFDRYNRTRAQMALVELLLSEGKIDTKEAINRLNTIRLSWRGDELERNVLKILGQLYIDTGSYQEGLRVWREVVKNFPNTPDALYIAKKMTQTFIYLFNQGGADRLSAFDALSLYYEFRELTPIGEQRDFMVRNIANRLFAVDLLEQAAILLTHQVRFRLQGEEKILMGTRLALLHLWNKQPALALEVLDVVDKEDHTPGIGTKRPYIRTQALSDLKRYKDALAVIENDESEEAISLRADIYWRMERWDRVAVVLMPRFRRLAYKTRTLTLPETDELIQLATVYTLQHKKHALLKLRQDFVKRIPKDLEEKKVTFDFLTKHLDAVDYRDIKATTKLPEFQTFLDRYREEAKANGLDSVTP